MKTVIGTTTSTFRANPIQSVADALRGVRTSFLSGQVDDAVRDCAETLEAHPENADAWFMLSVLEARRYDLPAALKAIEKAILLRPAHALFREAAARLNIEAKRLGVAASQLEIVDTLRPRSLRVSLRLMLLAMASHDRFGRRHWMRESMKRLPSSFGRTIWLWAGLMLAAPSGLVQAVRRRASPITAAKLQMAQHHARLGRSEAAMRLAVAAAKADFGNAEATQLLSHLHAQEGHPSRALEVAFKGLEIAPEHPGLLSTCAVALSRINRTTEALALLKRVKAKDRGAAGYARANALVHVQRGDIEAGWPYIERCLNLFPADGEVHEFAGRAFARLGWTAEANEFYQRAIGFQPNAVQAWVDLADAGRLSPDSPAFKHLNAQLSDPSLSQSTRARLHFVAGQACERAQRFDEAFGHFEQANFLTDAAFHPAGWAAHIDRLCQAFDAPYFARVSSFGDAVQRPIFIIGMPHAGTHLVEAILGPCSSIAIGGERPTLSLIADELVRRLTPATPWPGPVPVLDASSCKAAAARYGIDLKSVSTEAQHVTNSLPHNFLHLGLIATLFPNAIIIHCRRDPIDTCLSLYTRLMNREHAYGFDLGHLGAYHRHYERLMQHWRNVLPVAIHDVSHETLLADPRAVIEPLLGQLGLAWDEQYLAPLTAARARESNERAKRQAYQRHLGPLIAALGS